MRWSVVASCLLWCADVSVGLQCDLQHTSALKLSLTSLRNETGHWIAEMQLGHDAGDRSLGPWEVDIDHTTAKCEGSESILILAKVTAPPTTMITSPKIRGIPTAPGYELVPGMGYYKLHPDVNTWHGAMKICEEEGVHLAVINSEKEAQILKTLWDKIPPAKIKGGVHNDWAWIGFHDLYKEGEFVTIFNETLQAAGYKKFHPSEGRGGRTDNCVLVHRDLQLADYVCDQKNPFFCEKEI
ncbi:hemolymph lipopolysaccharide-binding protein-like [Periplaneta americana]|uniref:hemolymph lipopolysaccharide-binding protein-like n=1 Tax=Periplaneta americana TaxID=6978 RepID=UPI0037E81697